MTASPLTERVRTMITDRQPSAGVRAVSMFGGLSFMINNRMLVAVREGAGLLVRVDPARSEELRARPGAQPAEMGTGRSMGPSWLLVDTDAVAADDALTSWIDVALDYRSRSGSAST